MFDSNTMVCCPSIASMATHLVRTLRWPESDTGNTANAGSGRSSCVWLATYNPAGVWQKIRSGFSQLMIDGDFEPFSERWSRWAIVVDGVYGALAMWERRTDASASSCSATWNQQWLTPAAIDSGTDRINQSANPNAALRPTLDWIAHTATWPTPQADNANNGRNHKLDGTQYRDSATYGPTLVDAVTLWPTPRAEKIDGDASLGYSPTLHQVVSRWPTPKAGNGNGAGIHGQGSPDLQTVVTRWPTPQARDWKNGQTSNKTRGKNARPLNERVMQSETPMSESRYLNADWVEALIGFPPGWSIPDGPPGRVSPNRHGNRRAPSPKA
jgi:hypothetical protein